MGRKMLGVEGFNMFSFYKFKSDQYQPFAMQLLTRLTRLYAQVPHKTWSQAQPIFKDYYSRRLTLAPKQLQHFLLRLTTKHFSESDHRWLSLLQNVEGNLPKFPLQSRVAMLKALSTMGSRAELSPKLLQSVMGELNALTFQETALLLWCLSRNSSPTRVDDATKIYEHICSILQKHEEDGQMSIVIRKEETSEFEGKTLALKSTSICMVLSAMAKLGISEKTILKHLLRSGVKPNLSAFSINGLVSLLISLEKLGLRNKRDSLNIYLQIRKRAQELEVGPLETIQNLSATVVNLAYSTHFDEVEVDGRKKPQETVERFKEIRAGMDKLVLWLCETVQLRLKNNPSKEKSAKLLGNCGKVRAFDAAIWSNFLKAICTNIQDCKIIDLVMSLNALTRVTDEQRKMFAKEEEQICTRLWALYSSVTGKSLTVLAYLHDAKKITPPPKMAAILVSHTTKLRAMSEKARAEREAREEEGEEQEQETKEKA